MQEPWLTLAIRFGFGAALTWFAYDAADALGLVFAAPVWGLLLARPLFEVLATMHQHLKQSAWGEPAIERHSFRGDSLRVRDVAGHPWVVEVDLLRALGQEPSERSRRLADPARHAQLPDSKLWGYSEEGASQFLTSGEHPDAYQLKLYLERQVFLPARKKRERR